MSYQNIEEEYFLSNRTLLKNATLGEMRNVHERELLQEYHKILSSLNEDQKQLIDVREQETRAWIGDSTELDSLSECVNSISDCIIQKEQQLFLIEFELHDFLENKHKKAFEEYKCVVERNCLTSIKWRLSDKKRDYDLDFRNSITHNKIAGRLGWISCVAFFILAVFCVSRDSSLVSQIILWGSVIAMSIYLWFSHIDVENSIVNHFFYGYEVKRIIDDVIDYELHQELIKILYCKGSNEEIRERYLKMEYIYNDCKHRFLDMNFEIK